MEKVPRKTHTSTIKKPLLLLIPACIAILCFAVLYLLPRTLPPAALLDSEAPLYLFPRSADDIRSVTFTDAHQETFTLFIDHDGQMRLLGSEDVPLRNDVTASVLSVLDHLEAEDFLPFHEDEALNLADFGLDAPCLRVAVCYNDDETRTITIGDEAPFDVAAYYCQITGHDDLYILNADLSFPFFYEKDYYRAFTQPALDGSLLDKIDIQGAIDLSLMYTPSGWLLERPWQYPANRIKIQSLLQRIESMAFECCLGTAADVDMAALGLEHPVLSIRLTQAPTIVSGLDESWKSVSVDVPAHDYILHIGNETGASGVYLEWDGKIYKASNFLLGFWKELNPEDYLLQTPVNFLINDLSALTIRTNERQKQYDIQLVESITENNQIATDEYGQTLYDVMITRREDGQVIDAKSFLDWYLQLGTLTPSGKLSDTEIDSDSPLLTLILQASSLTRELSFSPYNAFYVAMHVDGTTLYYVDAAWIEKILSAP